MAEQKVSLSLFVPGAKILSSQECEKNPKESYNEEKVDLSYTKGKGKNKKVIKKVITIKTRKQRLITHNMSISVEAYKYMLSTPISARYSKPIKRDNNGDVIARVWDIMSIKDRLNKYFDILAHDFNAVSYSYEILDD